MLEDIEPKARRRYRGEDEAERRAGRRARLIEAGLKVFGSSGYRTATVKAVCREAGLTERYFYESFANREELFAAIYEHVVERMGKAIGALLENADETAEGKARALLDGYLGEIARDPELGRVLLIEVLNVGPGLELIYRDAMALFTDVLRKNAPIIFAKYDVARGEDELIAAGLVGAVVHVAMRWVISGFERPQSEIAAGLLEIFLAVSR